VFIISTHRAMSKRHCIILHHTITHCTTLHHTAPNFASLQHTATHRNTLQHTATHWVQSFYTLRPLNGADGVDDLCKRLLGAWQPLGVLGRVYVALEGVNAQVCVLQCVAVCAVCCRVMQCVALGCSVLQ